MAASRDPNSGKMTVKEAGLKGGAKVKELIQRGKSAENKEAK